MTSPIPVDRRNEIIAKALPMLAQGVSTEIIGASFGIDGSTLRGWLLTHAAPEAEQARADYLTRDLIRWQGEIESATDTIPLARAREGFRAAAWVAERRAPNIFGQRSEIHHVHDISDDLRAISERRRMRTIDQGDTTSGVLPAPKAPE